MAQKTICLEDVDVVKNNLGTGRKNHVTALHKFVFEDEGDRGNRKRLREFEGFNFNEDDDEYKRKMEYVENNLREADLMSICILLGLKDEEDKRAAFIFRNLRAGNLLQDLEQDDDEDDGDDKGEEGDEGNDDDDNISNDGVVPNNDANEENEYDDDVIEDDDGGEATRRPVDTNYNGRNFRKARQGRQNSPTSSDRYKIDVSRNNAMQSPKFALNFRDVEDSIKMFDGKSGMSVVEWVREFEEIAATMYWDQLQMLIFAKKSLSGLAKQFVSGEKGLTSWAKLKEALLHEFKPRVNSRQIHQRLTERTMKRGEGVMEYYYTMKDIAAEGNIVDKDLILYVIDGIKDLNINKQLLYGARDLQDFKEKIRDYEEYIAKNPTHNERRNVEVKVKKHEKNNVEMKKGNTNDNIKCYNCGENGHRSANCQNKNRGTKCFNCNGFGHLAKECRKRKQSNQENEVMNVVVKDPMMIEVIIENLPWKALIDTGSHINVMKVRVQQKLTSSKMTNTNIRMTGFGRGNEKMKPLGCVTIKAEINNETYILTFCVVPDDYMRDDIIIGAPICKQAEITVNPEGIYIRRWVVAEMMNIEVHAENDTEYEIDKMASREAKKVVHESVMNYRPVERKRTNVSMKIVLKDETPIASGPRRLPWCERQVVEEQIEEWLQSGIIECSESEFSSPIVLVKKKNGNKRLCVDYRRINKVIVRDRFPLPLIEDQVDRLKDATIFSTIDLKNGFFHVDVEQESRKYTSFVTHNGQYQFNKVPFGLANSPAVFQRFVNTIFRELTQKGIAMPYVDDIIIPAKDEEEALKNLKNVFELASDYGLNVNWEKCHFLKKRIEFLGHSIEDGKVSPSPEKMKAMINYPVPKTLKQVESFLGLAGYFTKFIPEFAKEAKALSDLKKKDSKFIMGEAQMVSFETLKKRLCEHPVLKIFNQEHETELHTDASADGYGAVLLQRSPVNDQLHPVYYMSKKTSELERKYSSYELEILAVVEAVKKFTVYLLGMKFKLMTDCNAFAKTMEKKDLTTRVARWLLLLQEYDYVIEHRSGTRMRHVDALSRCKVMAIAAESTLEKIARVQRDDENLKAIFEILQREKSYDEYYLKAKILYKLVNGKELLVVPKDLQYEIIKKAHEKGHFAFKKD